MHKFDTNLPTYDVYEAFSTFPEIQGLSGKYLAI